MIRTGQNFALILYFFGNWTTSISIYSAPTQTSNGDVRSAETEIVRNKQILPIGVPGSQRTSNCS